MKVIYKYEKEQRKTKKRHKMILFNKNRALFNKNAVK